MKKTIIRLAVAAAAVATVGALTAGVASAGTTQSGHDNTMADADPRIADNYYMATTSADYSQTKTTNAQWTILNSTLALTYNPYGSGWITTFTFTQKTPVTPVGSRQAASFGTVTHTTPYGTSTESFEVPAGTVAPWTVTPAGNVVVDPYSPAAKAISVTQVAMVYEHGGQNAAYWFPIA